MKEFLKAAQEIQLKLLDHKYAGLQVDDTLTESGDRFIFVTIRDDRKGLHNGRYTNFCSTIDGSIEAMKETASKYISELSE